MANKVYTVASLGFGGINMEKETTEEGQAITFTQVFGFQDADGNKISKLGSGRYSETVLIADIPANILSGLIAIKNYLETKSNEQELPD